MRSPAEAATNRGVPAPPRVSLNSYSSSDRRASLSTRHSYGLARMARQAAVRRSEHSQPIPPSINELVGAESDESDQLEPAIKVGVVDLELTSGS
jgi:hypothetical protein